MTDVVIVCNNKGNKLDELPTSVQRQYKITTGVNSAAATCELLAHGEKTTAQNLAYGNIIYVTSDIAGLRDYVGIVWPTDNGTDIRDEIITLNIRNYEWILATRFTGPQDVFSGTAGEIAAALLSRSRDGGYLPIQNTESFINKGGPGMVREYNRASIYKALNDLANDNGFLWYLQPTVDPVTNVLTMIFTWDFQKTRDFPVRVSTGGDNPQLKVDGMKERGEIASRVTAFGRFENWANPIEYTEDSTESQSFYGQVYEHVIDNNTETTVEGLIPIVQSYLATHAFPQLTLDGAILSTPFPLIGDIVTVELPKGNSYIVDRRGSDIQMQLTNAVYSPDDGSYAVHLEEIL